jgi:hypothetical protein
VVIEVLSQVTVDGMQVTFVEGFACVAPHEFLIRRDAHLYLRGSVRRSQLLCEPTGYPILTATMTDGLLVS